jgi:hypothetical protein
VRVDAIVREAGRNVTSGTTRAVTLVLVLSALGLAAVTADITAVAALQREAREFQASGGSILTVTAPGHVDGLRCERLAEVPGVRAAGALATPAGAHVTAVALPGAPLPLGHATVGLLAVLRATTDGGPGLILSGEASDALGGAAGSTLRTTDGTTRVSGVYEYPRDGRRDGYGYMALDVVRATGTFDACWVDAWPQIPSMRSLLLTTVRAGAATSETPPEVAPLNLSNGVEFDGSARYGARVTRWAGAALGVLAAVIAFVALRARRVELSSALHDRMSRVDLWAITFTEALAWVLPPVIVTASVGVAYFSAQGESLVGILLGGRAALPIAAGAVVGVSVALATTRERDLFRYAKDR